MENPYDDDYATREHVYRYSAEATSLVRNVTKLVIPFGWQVARDT